MLGLELRIGLERGYAIDTPSKNRQLKENNDNKYDLLRSVFEEDKQLFNHNNTSWVKSIFQMKNLFNLPSLHIYYSDFLEKMKLTYINKIMSQLSHIKTIQKRESFVSLVMYTQLLNYKKIPIFWY
jgi:hypothetical protein